MTLRSSLLAATLLLTHAGASQAALGDTPGNYGPANVTSTSAATNYSQRETTLPTGTRIREYVATGGKVFAVSWEGPFLPDLRELLGRHFETLNAEAARLPRAGRSQLTVKQPDIVIFSGGHMRAFAGHAWLPADLPAGFNTDELH